MIYDVSTCASKDDADSVVQYISGRFSNGYRATIGADFITKSLPHPSNPDESVTLQIWVNNPLLVFVSFCSVLLTTSLFQDTAGQERFSSLSTAFFRGADAALLMFDVNTPETMEALAKWWAEFRARAPLEDEDMEDYCCVVVGNKTDMPTTEGRVVEAEALKFLDQLVPPSSWSSLPTHEDPSELSREESDDNANNPLTTTDRDPKSQSFDDRQNGPMSSFSSRSRSSSILIGPNPNTYYSPPESPSSPIHRLTKSRSASSASRFYGGTMTTTHTTLTIYHTPSSSLFDVYQSARSSPEPWSSASSSPAQSNVRARRLTAVSTGSASSGSAVTITPSLFAREHAAGSSSTSAATTPEDDPYTSSLPPPPARGPKLFFTSAKTGEGVKDVFEYIAKRVVRRWEYEERLEARRMHFREASAADTIRLGLEGGKGGKEGSARWGACCGS